MSSENRAHRHFFQEPGPARKNTCLPAGRQVFAPIDFWDEIERLPFLPSGFSGHSIF